MKTLLLAGATLAAFRLNRPRIADTYSRQPQPGSRASAGQRAARLSLLRAPPNFRPWSGFFPAYSSCNPAMSALPVA